MKRTLLTMAILASFSLAVPAPQQQNSNLLDKGILTVYGTPKPNDCECVPYYQCQDGTIMEDGVGIIDIRSNFNDDDTQTTTPRSLMEFERLVSKNRRRRNLGPCTSYLDVCCKPPARIRQPNIDSTTTKVRQIPRTGCGKRNPSGVGFRIIGDKDNEAQFGEFPWMVAIMREETIGKNNQKLTVYQCGGSLIHRQAVLTAAHCVKGKQPSELTVRVGEWDTQTIKEIFPHQDRTVQNIAVHEEFYSGALHNDFAILILTEPVEFAENVDVVCLPERNEVFDSTRCWASGWGKNVFGKEGYYQVILKKIDLPVVPQETCQDQLRKTRLGKYFILHESFICAGGETGKDTCKGDGGSPLVCQTKRDPETYVQVGIVAWGIGCGENRIPGVYANIAFARDWIDQQMDFYNLDNTVYQVQPQAQNVSRVVNWTNLLKN